MSGLFGGLFCGTSSFLGGAFGGAPCVFHILFCCGVSRMRVQYRLPRPKELSDAGVKSCAGADGSSRTKSLSFLIHPSPSGCDDGDDVPADFLMNRNIDTSTRHGLIPQFLAHYILLASR
jgi:hypothetical protein